MIGGGRKAHDDMAMTIRFNPAFEFGQFRARHQFGPPAQVEAGSSLMRREINGQGRHRMNRKHPRRIRQ